MSTKSWGSIFLRVALTASIGLAGLCSLPGPAAAKEPVQEWEVIVPTGTVAVKEVKPAARPASLEGKTIVLRWNGKHNGENFLNRIAELFADKVPGAKVVKSYELDKSTVKFSGSMQDAARIARALKEMKADLVIGSQAD